MKGQLRNNYFSLSRWTALVMMIVIILLYAREFALPEPLVAADAHSPIEFQQQESKHISPKEETALNDQTHAVTENEPSNQLPNETESPQLPVVDESEAVEAEPIEFKPIALTFDDGPDATWTLQILDILRSYQVEASFFVVGLQVEKHPEVLLQILEDGHLIGNHTFAHEDLTKLSTDQIQQTIDHNAELIYDTIGMRPTLFRAPYGALNNHVKEALEGLGYKHTGWTIDTKDWQGISSEEIVESVKQGAAPGGIILQHSLGGQKIEQTVKALPEIIEYLHSEGYTFVTVDKLL